MPVINVTQAEYEALFFFHGETEDKVEGAQDEGYIAEVRTHSSTFRKFEAKFKKAQAREEARKMVKKILKTRT
ncbi:hypothetical protein ACQWTT_001135 [Acinetobacter baumannii]